MLILVVDDEAPPRQRLIELLQTAGHTVVEARTGEEALAELGRQPFDVLITDVVMPEMDGIELLGRVKRAFPALKTIVLSASDYSQDAVFLKMARTLGADAAFKKSVSAEELRLVIETFQRR